MTRPVWVVDDNAALAESVVLLLHSQGLGAEAFTRAGPALQRLEAGEEPGAMVLDMLMPGDCGNVVLGKLLANPAWTFPVIVLTGWGEEVIRKEYRGRVFKIMPKTGEPLDLVAVVRRALGETP